MTWHPISEPPPHPERPHTAMLRRTDHECVCLLPGPVMWDASTSRWTKESGAPVRFDADAEYHWRDEEDILADHLLGAAIQRQLDNDQGNGRAASRPSR